MSIELAVPGLRGHAVIGERSIPQRLGGGDPVDSDRRGQIREHVVSVQVRILVRLELEGGADGTVAGRSRVGEQRSR